MSESDKDQSGDNPAAKRTRKIPDRFGVQTESSDYNEMFSALAKNAEENSQSNEKTSPDQNDISVEGESSDSIVLNKTIDLNRDKYKQMDVMNHHDLLKLIFRKVDAIENHLIELHVRIDQMPNVPAMEVEQTGVIDVDVLKKLGLPSNSQSELNELEDKLKNNEVFKEELVSDCYSFFLVY